MFLDLNEVTIEEVIGQLCVFEERAKPKEITDAMGRLMLCEEDWEARRKAHREQDSSGAESAVDADAAARNHHRGMAATARTWAPGTPVAGGHHAAIAATTVAR